MLRFVILDHDYPAPHFDLMLEHEGRLRTWRIHGPPDSDSDLAAEPLGDHRIAYLDYEGPVSGGRGRVVRWDAGTYQPLDETAQGLRFQLNGTRCRGMAELQKSPTGWTFRYSRMA
jgi:hypothetical protein